MSSISSNYKGGNRLLGLHLAFHKRLCFASPLTFISYGRRKQENPLVDSAVLERGHCAKTSIGWQPCSQKQTSVKALTCKWEMASGWGVWGRKCPVPLNYTRIVPSSPNLLLPEQPDAWTQPEASLETLLFPRPQNSIRQFITCSLIEVTWVSALPFSPSRCF